MSVRLNYKSFCETFQLGVIDKRFTSVAKLLFFPIFNDHSIFDINGEPYEINSQIASRWGNGLCPIPHTIQEYVSVDSTLNKIIDYFNRVVVTQKICKPLIGEMLEAMVNLINSSDLGEIKKQELIKYHKDGKIGEFLARTFQRALLGNNKVAVRRVSGKNIIHKEKSGNAM